jgi:hypothetical protein
MRDYFQFLRGAGLHPLGSLAQLTDAFGRVIYDPGRSGADGSPRFGLAASWFPVAAAGVVPDWSCATGGAAPTVRGGDGGLCGSVRPGGTSSAAIAPVLTDPRITVFGAKTGTIDGLADVSEDRTSCERWNRAHTVPGAGKDKQPYWLPCDEIAEDDSLFLIAFAVQGPAGPVPFTLGIRLERTGKGVAALAARHYLAAIAAYVTGPASSQPSPASSPSSPASPPPAPAP